MKDLTYILPTRIESDDRLKNIITSVTYILKKIPDAKVIVKEVSERATFKYDALPKIKEYDYRSGKYIVQINQNKFIKIKPENIRVSS